MTNQQDEVRLTVPAMPEFLRLARVTAAGLASRLGFSFDEVDDLRLAIDELCFGLIGSQGHPNGTVEVSYHVEPDRLEVVGLGRFPGDRDPPHLSELSTVILSALVDEHAMTVGTDGPCFRLVKRRD